MSIKGQHPDAESMVRRGPGRNGPPRSDRLGVGTENSSVGRVRPVAVFQQSSVELTLKKLAFAHNEHNESAEMVAELARVAVASHADECSHGEEGVCTCGKEEAENYMKTLWVAAHAPDLMTAIRSNVKSGLKSPTAMLLDILVSLEREKE